MTWLHSPEINPLDYEGFVYLITNNVTGKAYVGRKYIYRFSKGKIVGESDWRTYWGSCKPLLADIEALGAENFTREILHFCRTRGETNLLEVEEQFKREVLRARLPNGERAFYNNSIMGRYFSRTADSYATGNKRSISVERVLYEKNPKKCEACGGPIPFNKRSMRKYCSQRCSSPNATKFSDRKHSAESRQKISESGASKFARSAGYNSISELIDQIKSLRSLGLTQAAISEKLGISKSSVRKYLKRPVS